MNAGNDKEYMERLSEKEQTRAMNERMRSLAKSTIEDFEIHFKPGHEWEFNVKNHEMSYVPQDLLEMTDRQVIAEVLHNLGHALFTEMPKFKARTCPEPKRKFFQLLNAIEDIRIEERMMARFPGTYDKFWYKYKKADSQVANQVERMLPKDVQFLYSLVRFFWGEEMKGVDQKVVQKLQEANEYLQEAFQAEMDDMVEIARTKIWPIYEELLDEPPKDDSKKEGDGEGEGEGEGEAGASGTPPKAETPEEKERKEQLEKMAKEAISMEDIEKLMKELTKEMSSKEKKEDEKETLEADVDAEFDKKESKFDDLPDGNAQYGQDDPVLGKNKNPHEEPTKAAAEFLTYETMYREILPYLPFFQKKLSSIMKDNRYNRRGGAYRSGKLDTKKLFKFKAGNVKMFNRKVIRRHKDYKVTILVDESGSMGSSDKNRQAAKACVLFAEVLDRVGVDFEIRAFNASDRLYKAFHEKLNWKHRRRIENIIPETHSYDAGDNNDGFAVNKAIHHLRSAGDRFSERILIVLSDGLPAEGYEDIPKEDKKRLPPSKHRYNDFDLHHEILEGSKHAMLIGVGINARHVQDYYPTNVICDDVSELPTMVLNALKKKFKRG